MYSSGWLGHYKVLLQAKTKSGLDMFRQSLTDLEVCIFNLT